MSIANCVSKAAQEIAEFVGGHLNGNGLFLVDGVCTLSKPAPHKLCFAERLDRLSSNKQGLAESLIIGPPGIADIALGPSIAVPNPRLAYALAVAHFFHQRGTAQIATSACISESARVGSGVSIGEGCVIGPNAVIGDKTELGHNVILGPAVRVGQRCIIGSNTVIGQVGFGLATDSAGCHVRIPHVGSVVIGDEVEIGALTSIAAGTIEPTIIRDRAKIDDHVFIAHNCYIDEDAIVIACAEISGSVNIGKRTWVGPSVSIRDGVTVPADTLLGIGCTVVKTLTESGTYIGTPASLMSPPPATDSLKR